MIRRPFRIEADGWPNQAGQEILVKMGQTLTLTTRGEAHGLTCRALCKSAARACTLSSSSSSSSVVDGRPQQWTHAL